MNLKYKTIDVKKKLKETGNKKKIKQKLRPIKTEKKAVMFLSFEIIESTEKQT